MMIMTAGSLAAVPLRAVTTVRRAPVTVALLAILAWTSYRLGHMSHPHRLLRMFSTNLDNLAHFPVRSMIGSALVLAGGPWLFWVAALGLSLGALERRIGSLRAVGVFASGHVIATLLTEGAVWIGISAGILPVAESHQLDIGVSYGMWACAGAALVFLSRRWRVAVLVVLVGLQAVSFVLDPDMSAYGHLLSMIIGIAWWPVLGQARNRATSALRTYDSAHGDAGSGVGWWRDSRFARIPRRRLRGRAPQRGAQRGHHPGLHADAGRAG
jgi:hypothetical protein